MDHLWLSHRRRDHLMLDVSTPLRILGRLATRVFMTLGLHLNVMYFNGRWNGLSNSSTLQALCSSVASSLHTEQSLLNLIRLMMITVFHTLEDLLNRWRSQKVTELWRMMLKFHSNRTGMWMELLIEVARLDVSADDRLSLLTIASLSRDLGGA